MLNLTYGTLPDREAFQAAFDAACPDGLFAFGNDPRYARHFDLKTITRFSHDKKIDQC